MKNSDNNHLFIHFFKDFIIFYTIIYIIVKDYFPALQNKTRFLVDCLTDITFNFDRDILFLRLVKKASAFISECKDSECYKAMGLWEDCGNVLINLALILSLNYFFYFVKAFLALFYQDLDDTFIFLIFSFTFDMSRFKVVLVYADDTYNFIVEDCFSLIIKVFFFIKFVEIVLLYIDFFSLLLEAFFNIKSFVTFSFLNE